MINANLLPRVEKAGGGHPLPPAAGRPIIVCGDLSAKRPGSGWTRNPVRLPAERLRLGAISDFFFLTCVVWSAANTTGHREPVTDRIRVRRGPALGGIWKNVRLLNPARNPFSGLGRALQPSEQSRSGLTDRFQVNHSLRDAPASEMQEITGARSCLTQGGSHPTRSRVSV